MAAGGMACISAKNLYGATPLHCAALGGREEAACWLLSKGCDAAAKDVNECLPEELAEVEGHIQLASILKEKRAKFGL